MGKTVTSVSLDEDIAEMVDDDPHVSRSSLVNQFLREYYSTGTASGLQFRLRRIERELEQAREKADKLEQERDQLEAKLEKRESEVTDGLDEKLDRLTSIPAEKLSEENPAIVKQAQKLNMPPSELYERVKERR